MSLDPAEAYKGHDEGGDVHPTTSMIPCQRRSLRPPSAIAQWQVEGLQLVTIDWALAGYPPALKF
ncbi:hypothetical protein IE4872_CH02738 [Rhizobium gallicum]|uniref:Uncharacterized protein n=1 Tax=Rhizobium gallicum TaxID=56730 RepID=A0A1L5NKB7_9HYPH|nr:hypothetical protein [Rhizobium gallicum]APO68343.1 hypothetical protein IE4872_CH02738 [Rhizobium gallicum]